MTTLVLPATLTHDQATACSRMLGQAVRAMGDGQAVADASALRARFGWTPRYDDLDDIVRTSLAWERKLVAGEVKEGRASR